MDIRTRSGESILVDDKDAERVSGITWYRHRNGHTSYAIGFLGEGDERTHVLMHRLILDAPTGMNVDHVNGNGLDNRRVNLRIVTQAQNCMNRRVRSIRTSRFRGVHFDKGQNRWRAQIRINGKLSYVGRFRSEEDAAIAYDKVARSLFGEFGRYNFPKDNEQTA